MYIRIGRVIKKYPYTNEIRECVVKDGKRSTRMVDDLVWTQCP
jgi:hypothetical protein